MHLDYGVFETFPLFWSQVVQHTVLICIQRETPHEEYNSWFNQGGFS